jgi:hypothetical protein
MNKNKIEAITPLVLFDYMLLISSVFGGVLQPEEFVEAFNGAFPHYQYLKKKQIDPYYMSAEGATMCTSAALLMGLWGVLSENYKPAYYVAQFPPVGQQMYFKSTAHCKVALASSSSQTPEYFHLKKATDTTTGVEKLRFSAARPPDRDEYALINKTPNFTARAVSIYGFRNNRVIELLNPTSDRQKLAKELSNQPEVFFTYLKWCYANRAQA